MSVCIFFGHSSCPESIREKLRESMVDLIENKGVTLFYVGHQGEFDRMVLSVLRELKGEYDIDYAIIWTYLPEKRGAAQFAELAQRQKKTVLAL